VGLLAALEQLWEERVAPGLREWGAEVVAWPAWVELPRATRPAPGVPRSLAWAEQVGQEPPFAHLKVEVQQLCLGQLRADRHWAAELTSPPWLEEVEEEVEEEEQRRASELGRY